MIVVPCVIGIERRRPCPNWDRHNGPIPAAANNQCPDRTGLHNVQLIELVLSSISHDAWRGMRRRRACWQSEAHGAHNLLTVGVPQFTSLITSDMGKFTFTRRAPTPPHRHTSYDVVHAVNGVLTP